MIRSTLLTLGLLFTLHAAHAQTDSADKAPPASKSPAKTQDENRRADDFARHRQMARAHEDAAKCLEAGEKESACHERLRAACQGIAVGRYCGIRHQH